MEKKEKFIPQAELHLSIQCSPNYMLQIPTVISLIETPLPKKRGKQDPQGVGILSPVIFCL